MRKLVLNNSSQKIQKQFCKSIFIFICYFKFFSKNTPSLIGDDTLFLVNLAVLPKTHKTITLLKSSFVNKIAKKNYSLERYFFVLTFFFKDKHQNLYLTKTGCKILMETLALFFSTFESNICFNQRIKISIPLTLI